MKRIIGAAALCGGFFVIMTGISCAETFFVQDVAGLQSSVDNALASTTTGRASAFDARGNKYRVQLTEQNGNCRVGVVIASNGDTAQSSICKSSRSKVRQQQYTPEQQILTRGYAVSMQENVDVGAQYGLRGRPDAPYQSIKILPVNQRAMMNAASPEEFDERYRRWSLMTKQHGNVIQNSGKLAEVETRWTSGDYNREYNQERYPGQHQVEREQAQVRVNRDRIRMIEDLISIFN